MMSFAEWRKKMWGGQGLGDKQFPDNGEPQTPKNKKVPDKYKIPSVPFYRYEQEPGVATKLDPGK